MVKLFAISEDQFNILTKVLLVFVLEFLEIGDHGLEVHRILYNISVVWDQFL